MAAPHVAGAWALLKQKTPTASVDSLLSSLQSTGTPVADTRVTGGVTKPRINTADAAGVPVQRPANDAFSNAQTLTGANATVTGTNVSATKESGEPNHAGNAGGKSVWYNWTPQASGTTTIDTAGSNFDTLLAVYTGGAVNSLTNVASNDDENLAGGVRTSKLSFVANGGTTYRIAVDGFAAVTGDIGLRLVSADSSAPKVNSTSPTNNATGVSRTANVTATFSEAMNEASVEAAGVVTLKKSSGGAAVAANVTYNPTTETVILNPNLSLARNTLYTAKVTTGVRDLAGNQLDQNSATAGNQAKTWKFTTVP
jgi:hypothetical protein